MVNNIDKFIKCENCSIIKDDLHQIPTTGFNNPLTAIRPGLSSEVFNEWMQNATSYLK